MERDVVLCVLAHQDDECFLSTQIEREASRGTRVACAVLTDGVARGVPASVRDAETLRVLRRLGVESADVHFLGSRHGIPSESLVDHLEDALGLLERVLAGRIPARLYTLAYEGGHPDHDAAHLVTAALAARRGCLGGARAAPAYHGCGTRLFRALSPLPGTPEVMERRLSLAQALRHTRLPVAYPSQWRTWVGLAPHLVVQRLVRRRETLMPLDPARLRSRPHDGPLLYERFLGLPYSAFRAASAPFLDRYLPRTG